MNTLKQIRQSWIKAGQEGTYVGCFHVDVRLEAQYPRIQCNKKGEVVLAFSKSRGSLTRGILIGFTEDCTIPKNKRLPIGKMWDDWEVGGQLADYDGIFEINALKIANKEPKREKVQILSQSGSGKYYAAPPLQEGDVVIDNISRRFSFDNEEK